MLLCSVSIGTSLKPEIHRYGMNDTIVSRWFHALHFYLIVTIISTHWYMGSSYERGKKEGIFVAFLAAWCIDANHSRQVGYFSAAHSTGKHDLICYIIYVVGRVLCYDATQFTNFLHIYLTLLNEKLSPKNGKDLWLKRAAPRSFATAVIKISHSKRERKLLAENHFETFFKAHYLDTWDVAKVSHDLDNYENRIWHQSFGNHKALVLGFPVSTTTPVPPK